MRSYLLVFCFIFLPPALYSQEVYFQEGDPPPKSLDEVMKKMGGDTVLLFYDEAWGLVKPSCAALFRIARLDSMQNFTGNFVDYYSDSVKAAEGVYINGIKHGLFKIYYHNGKLQQVGVYSNDCKKGEWDYYYENGTLKQMLDFAAGQPDILEAWDENGKQMVEAGNGYWKGYETPEKFRLIEGEVLNGKKNGTWKISLPRQGLTVNVEKYEAGKFLKGHFISVVNGKEPYTKDTSFCNVEKSPAFINAEYFGFGFCSTQPATTMKNATYPGGPNKFFTDLRRRTNLLGTGVKGLIKIEITINEKGRVTGCTPLSSTGLESRMSEALLNMQNWTPAEMNGKKVPDKRTIVLELR